MSPSLVPAFFRASVPVYRGRTRTAAALVGKLALTERETVGDVRALVAAMLGASVAPAHVALYKRGVIPIHAAQNHKLAHHFLAAATDYVCAVESVVNGSASAAAGVSVSVGATDGGGVDTARAVVAMKSGDDAK